MSEQNAPNEERDPKRDPEPQEPEVEAHSEEEDEETPWCISHVGPA